MRIEKVKTRRGKRFLEERAPKLVENDKAALIVRAHKTSETVNKALHELYLLKKPLATQLQRKNEVHPFEDESLLCKFSYKFDSSLFVFGSSTKKRPNMLTFGRMFDHQLLDMVELRMEKFVSMEEFKSKEGITLGVKPCILLQGPLFESDECMQRLGSLMVDWFRGTKAEHVRLQGLELVIALTALSTERVLLRVYRAALKKSSSLHSSNSMTPSVELVEIGPNIDFKIDRKKLASDALIREALKKPKSSQQKSGANRKGAKFDTFGNKVANVHTGRQQTEGIQTRKVKALKRGRINNPNVKRFDEEEGESGGETDQDHQMEVE